MKKKGQALVEFIIILPVFLILLLGVFDIGKLFYMKIRLEDQISDVVDLYKKGESQENIKNKLDIEEIDVKKEDTLTNLTIYKNISIITPGLNLILKNPYKIEVSRSILNETG